MLDRISDATGVNPTASAVDQTTPDTTADQQAHPDQIIVEADLIQHDPVAIITSSQELSDDNREASEEQGIDEPLYIEETVTVAIAPITPSVIPTQLYRIQRISPEDVANIAAFLSEPVFMDDDAVSAFSSAPDRDFVEVDEILAEHGIDDYPELVKDFLKKSVVADANGFILRSNMSKAFSAYCKVFSWIPVSPRTLSTLLENCHIFESGVRNARIYPGIQWKNDTPYRPKRIKTQYLADIEFVH